MDSTARALRAVLLALVGLGLVATAADLLLIEHHADAWQVTPLGLLGVSLAALLWAAASPAPLSLRVFQGAMGLLVLGGAAGLWLHYLGNIEFEREVSPGITGGALFWKAVKGASPPSLAPAGLIHLGLLGLAATYRHPLLGRPAAVPFTQGVE